MSDQAAVQKIVQTAEWLKGQLAQTQSKKILLAVFFVLCVFLPSCFGITDGPRSIPPKKVGEIVVPLPNLQLNFFEQHDRTLLIPNQARPATNIALRMNGY
jgi:hypothetical protein